MASFSYGCQGVANKGICKGPRWTPIDLIRRYKPSEPSLGFVLEGGGGVDNHNYCGWTESTSHHPRIPGVIRSPCQYNTKQRCGCSHGFLAWCEKPHFVKHPQDVCDGLFARCHAGRGKERTSRIRADGGYRGPSSTSTPNHYPQGKWGVYWGHRFSLLKVAICWWHPLKLLLLEDATGEMEETLVCPLYV